MPSLGLDHHGVQQLHHVVPLKTKRRGGVAALLQGFVNGALS
jgi:hypothetical protein